MEGRGGGEAQGVPDPNKVLALVLPDRCQLRPVLDVGGERGVRFQLFQIVEHVGDDFLQPIVEKASKFQVASSVQAIPRDTKRGHFEHNKTDEYSFSLRSNILFNKVSIVYVCAYTAVEILWPSKIVESSFPLCSRFIAPENDSPWKDRKSTDGTGPSEWLESIFLR
jgi:hypothetical protein